MRSRTLSLVLSFVLGSSAFPQERTWVEIRGTVHGAKPDARGPIGGGKGYKAIVKSGNHTATDLDSLIEALSRAKAGEVVFIPGETEIDLTARVYIEKLALVVPAGVTLAGERGRDGTQGAILTSDSLDTPCMIRAGGPGVRITGLRVRGPNPKRYLEHHNRAFGTGGAGRDYYNKFPRSDGIVSDQPELEVDNCEISAFGHAGILLLAGTGHRVHHNSIHHCQYQGLGYGVCHDAAASLIENNLFDSNRHSIAGTGRPGCSYVAKNNVELGVSLAHCFDMHGGADRGDGTEIAGTAIEISNNTFRAPETPIVIRGVPQEKCDVHHNWFVQHAEPGQAVTAGAKTDVHDNAYGPRPTASR